MLAQSDLRSDFSQILALVNSLTADLVSIADRSAPSNQPLNKNELEEPGFEVSKFKLKKDLFKYMHLVKICQKVILQNKLTFFHVNLEILRYITLNEILIEFVMF